VSGVGVGMQGSHIQVTYTLGYAVQDTLSLNGSNSRDVAFKTSTKCIVTYVSIKQRELIIIEGNQTQTQGRLYWLCQLSEIYFNLAFLSTLARPG
jgi:hypothetical protein